MLSVSLKSIPATALYGLYPEEQQVPNRFEVDVSAALEAASPEAAPFVDYQLLHDAVQAVFRLPPSPQTLERLVAEITAALRTLLPANSRISVVVRKLSPALGSATAHAAITWQDKGIVE